jgi:arginyl-tRNA--protein-N-Asp/Glu arginylyltransferase
VEEARKEIRRLMSIRAEGGTKRLMQVGFRKWRETFYRPDKGRYLNT